MAATTNRRSAAPRCPIVSTCPSAPTRRPWRCISRTCSTSYNSSVNEIAADPTLAADPATPALEAYLRIFELDSTAAAQAVAFWRNQAAVGDSTRPYSPDRPAFVTRLDGPVETVSEDEVTFPTCVEVAFETVNAQGQRVDVEPGASVPGEGTAVRIGDGWLLRRLDQFAGTEGCRGEG